MIKSTSFSRAMRLSVFLAQIILAAFLADPGPAFAQRVYSELDDEAQIQVFTEVSDGLVCQCGCHMVLSTCPHVECPWGIPARRFIENRIRAGMDAEQILKGFESGFGITVTDDPVVLALRAQGRADLAERFIAGFGPKVRARTGHTVPALLVLLFSVAMFWLGRRWLRRNRTKASPAAAGKPESSPSPTTDTLDRNIKKRREDLER